MREFTFNFAPERQQHFTVNSGWVFDGFKIGQQNHIGGSGGAHTTFVLAPGESIVKAYGCRIHFEQKLCIGQVTFETNFGAVHGPFGTNGNPAAPSPPVENFLHQSYQAGQGAGGQPHGHGGHGHGGHHGRGGHGHGHGNHHGHGGQQPTGPHVSGLRKITGKVVPGRFIHSMNFIFQD